MRRTLVALVIVLAATGCTSAPRLAAVGDDAGSAAPGPDLVGVWRGTAFAIPGSLYMTTIPVEIEIRPDGTWTWKSRGAAKATGTIARQGGHVILHAGPSKGTPGAAADEIPLDLRGDHLWGLSRYFIPGAPSAIDLHRQERAS